MCRTDRENPCRIIRGGENISPSAVEAVLAKNKLLSPLIPQIVGAKDAIAGEVPVAVIRGKVTPEIREAIQSEVVARMGALYVPEEVVSTEDLGLSDYPRTTSGKIQKPKLTSLVNQHRKQAESRASDRPRRMLDKEQLTDLIKKIWAKAVGLDPLRIQLDASTSEFADSITIMRVREGIKRQTGKALSLQDMATAGTIRKQVDVLLAMQSPAHGSTTTPARRTARKGPPALNDMVHLTEHPELLESTKMLVVDTIGKYGLGWDDVEDVIPAYDFNSIMTQTKLNEDWTWHFAIQAVDKVDRRVGADLWSVLCNSADSITETWQGRRSRCDEQWHVGILYSIGPAISGNSGCPARSGEAEFSLPRPRHRGRGKPLHKCCPRRGREPLLSS